MWILDNKKKAGNVKLLKIQLLVLVIVFFFFMYKVKSLYTEGLQVSELI